MKQALRVDLRREFQRVLCEDGEGSDSCGISTTANLYQVCSELSVESSSCGYVICHSQSKTGIVIGSSGRYQYNHRILQNSRLPPAASGGESQRLLGGNLGTLKCEKDSLGSCWSEMEGTMREGICVAWRS